MVGDPVRPDTAGEGMALVRGPTRPQTCFPICRLWLETSTGGAQFRRTVHSRLARAAQSDDTPRSDGGAAIGHIVDQIDRERSYHWLDVVKIHLRASHRAGYLVSAEKPPFLEFEPASAVKFDPDLTG